MNPVFHLRLVLDLLAVALFMLALAYWWLDNRTHELIGTGMFALLFLHNVFNRRWYGGLPRTPRKPKPVVTVLLNLTLLATMVTLLTTSVLISQSLFGFMAVGGPTARDIHILAAYWALVILSLHLGMHWQIFMSMARRIAGVTRGSFIRTTVLRIAALCIAAKGFDSSFDLAVGSRLLLIPTMEFWDFSEGAWGFFLRVGSIVGLYAAIGHYSVVVIASFRTRRGSGSNRAS